MSYIYWSQIGTVQNMRALESVLVTVRGAYPNLGWGAMVLVYFGGPWEIFIALWQHFKHYYFKLLLILTQPALPNQSNIHFLNLTGGQQRPPCDALNFFWSFKTWCQVSYL